MGTHQEFSARQGGRLRRDGEGQPTFYRSRAVDSAYRFTLAGFAVGIWSLHRVYVRYSRWGKKGTWSQLSSSVSDVPDLEYLMVDGSIVRVHQHGAAKKTAKTMKP
jgi:transposase